MIVQCADCKTRYRLQPELVPPQRIKVRCMRCDHVFAIDGREADRPVAASPRNSGPAAAVDPGRFGELTLDSGRAAPRQVSRPVQPTSGPAAPASASSGRVAMDLEIERSSHAPLGHGPARRSVSGSATAVETPVAPPRAPFQEVDLDAPARTEAKSEPDPAPASGPERREKDKARRLARALVSDILVYNRDKRDQALKQGNLVQILGPEIKKSWEVYKERVTPEVANSTNHFREALNEILAEGQPIF
jgi:predicted Zn finger-like uncharacterized protein